MEDTLFGHQPDARAKGSTASLRNRCGPSLPRQAGVGNAGVGTGKTARRTNAWRPGGFGVSSTESVLGRVWVGLRVESRGGACGGAQVARTVDAVQQDVAAGDVGIYVARDRYGVVLEAETLAVNEVATLARREKLRKV